MSQRRPQKAKARNPWLPMRREHYRRVTHTATQTVFYPDSLLRVQQKAGSLRDTPFALAAPTGRWFQRCNEDLVVAFKNVEGFLMAELGHMIRRPSHDEPFLQDGRRKPDFFAQHTKSWRYCLDQPQHVRAFWELINYSTSYVAGQRNRSRPTDLYSLKLGDSKELARWPLSGMMRYDATHKTCEEAEQGQEVLEVLCVPGERPRRPASLCGADYSHRVKQQLRQAKRGVKGAVALSNHQAQQIERLKGLAPAISEVKRAIGRVKDGPPDFFFPHNPKEWWVEKPELRRVIRQTIRDIRGMRNHFDSWAAKQLNGLIKALLKIDQVQEVEWADTILEDLWSEALKHYGKIGRRFSVLRKRELKKAQEMKRQHDRLLAARDKLQRTREHWYRQLRETKTTKLMLRLRRVCVHKGTEQPAFYINDATELDLPFKAVEQLSERLPGYWSFLFHEVYEKQAARSWPTKGAAADGDPVFRQYKKAELFGSKRELYKRAWRSIKDDRDVKIYVLKDQEALSGIHVGHRQYRWSESLVRRYLQPGKMAEACRFDPQPGLFACDWTDDVERGSQDYMIRLALWDANLLRWNPCWSVDAQQAFSDVHDMYAQQRDEQLDVLTRLFLVACCLRRAAVVRHKPRYPTTKLLRSSTEALEGWSIRGPPPG